MQTHKAKLKKETNNDNFRLIQKPGTPEGHRSMTSHLNVINKCGQRVYIQGDEDYDKHIGSVNNPYKKK